MKKMIFAIGLFLTVSCTQSGQSESVKTKEEIENLKNELVEKNIINLKKGAKMIEEYIKEKKLDTEVTGTGLRYVITEKGDGVQAQPDQIVQVHYTGMFLNGKIFDSSLDRGKPHEFVLGKGQVIKGWDEGVGLLSVGDKATLIIPAHLAYGERGVPGVIPSNTPMVFEVELVAVK
ncbi:FKBP-type peptidyl-prolyl cis-trans isomerase [bacterium AH-315-C07]|nr:FKBP-type peptidyl-prolyl cis-trans isomerase [bacterium AH-315-C07]